MRQFRKIYQTKSQKVFCVLGSTIVYWNDAEFKTGKCHLQVSNYA